MRKKYIRRFLLFLCLLLLGAALAAWLFPHQVLTVDSGPVKADVLVVLGGGSFERPRRSAELFKAGEAPRIILSGKGDSESEKRFLVAAGVPESAIEIEGKSTSTKENAEFTVAMLRAQGAEQAIIVTSWYHSRRALQAFQHYAPDLQFYSRPSYFGYPRIQWSRERISGYIRAEYIKIAGYWLCYGISPF